MDNKSAHRLERLRSHLTPDAALAAPRRGVSPAPCVASGGAPGYTVAVLGGAGGIGQPLALLLKMSPLVSELRLYDVMPVVKGVAVDLSHCDVAGGVKGFHGPAELGACLSGCDVVVIPAGVPRKPGMTRDDLFNTNAGIVLTLMEGVAEHCPNAIVNIISNPVNSTVPIAAEVLKRRGVFNPKRVFGVTSLDVARAQAFVAERAGVDPHKGCPAVGVTVPVVGGHAGKTILPLLSQAGGGALNGGTGYAFGAEEAAALTDRIQNAGTEVVDAKAGGGSATLSMAYAAARFAERCMAAMSGEPNVIECAYVASNVCEGVGYFASPLRLGREGVAEYLPIGPLDAAERAGLDAMKKELVGSINKGVAFANKNQSASAHA